jgi:group II intron reverse transcriptase/maturase
VYKHRFVLEADIEGFFDNVSHRKLLGMLKYEIVDVRIHRLIERYLRAGYMERDKPWHPTWRGTPQGGPLSPMLANVYLHYALDVRFKGLKLTRSQLFRYCDDFIIISQSELELGMVRQCLDGWMRKVGLKLKGTKTKMVDMRNHQRGHQSHFDFLGFRYHLRAFKDNAQRYWIARQPSEEARKAFRENLTGKLKSGLPIGYARTILKSVWRGWTSYFRYGNSNRIFYKELKSMRQIIRLYLRQKFRQQNHPVPWRRLCHVEKWILRELKPPRVIPNYFSQQQLLLL